MKKLIALCLALALFFAVRPVSTAHATGNVQLSSLSDEGILAFLDEYNIEIPEGFAESDTELARIVRAWITAVENKPNAVFAYNFPDLKNVSSAVKDAVNDYYGHTPVNGYIPTISTYGVIDRLQQNSIWAIPSNAADYNGYAYVLGLTLGDYYPGYFSNNRYSTTTLQSLTVDQLAEYVMFDLDASLSSDFTNECVTTTLTRPDYSDLLPGQTVICIRMGEDDYGFRDYHLMKLFYDEDEGGDIWLHKPGDSAIMKFNSYPSNSVPWICEGYFSQSYQIHDSNLTFTSTIHYIIFSEEHSITTTATGYHYHSGNSHYYEYEEYCAGCNTEWTYYTSVPCSDCNGEVVYP